MKPSAVLRRLVIVFVMLGTVATLGVPLAAAQDDEECCSEVELLKRKVERLETDLAKSAERRDYYQKRTVTLKEENAELKSENVELEARIAELEGEETQVAAPAAGGMTADERSYLRASRDIMGGAVVDMLATNEIASDPDFASDIELWFELIDAMGPMHDYWAQIQTLSPPPRLVDLHQAYVDCLYNWSQAATLYEEGINNLDVAAIEQGTRNLEAGTEALNRATDLIAAYEADADADLSTDLD